MKEHGARLMLIVRPGNMPQTRTLHFTIELRGLEEESKVYSACRCMLQAGRFYRKNIIREAFLESEGMGIRGERTSNKSGRDTEAYNLGVEGSEAKAGTLQEVGKL